MFLAEVRSAHKTLEPILQEMKVKEKARREAHLLDIRIEATWVMQLVGKDRSKESLLLHQVCQECGCVLLSDMCCSPRGKRLKAKEHEKALDFTKVASSFSTQEACTMTNSCHLYAEAFCVGEHCAGVSSSSATGACFQVLPTRRLAES